MRRVLESRLLVCPLPFLSFPCSCSYSAVDDEGWFVSLNQFDLVYADLKLGVMDFGKWEYGSRNSEKQNIDLLLPIVSGGRNGGSDRGAGRAHGGASIRRHRFDARRDNSQRIRQQLLDFPLPFFIATIEKLPILNQRFPSTTASLQRSEIAPPPSCRRSSICTIAGEK